MNTQDPKYLQKSKATYILSRANYFVHFAMRYPVKVAENPEDWKRKVVAVAIKYSDQEMAGAKERMMAHMARYM